MTLSTWWLFVVMTFVVSATPGPNMLLVMHTSARHGLRVAVVVMAGCMSALLIMMGLSATGLGALLQAFPAVFDALRLAGAAYLAYLGVKGWRSPVDGQVGNGMDRPTEPSLSVGGIFRQGFVVAASNPKAILFAAAFFPQFIDHQLPKLNQFMLLIATFTMIEVGWYCVYAISGKRLSVYLSRASVLRAFNRLTGGVFIGFAAAMAFARE